MGIVEKLLVKFEQEDQQYRIEYNKGGMIHIHVDNMRLDMTPEEFEYFAEIVGEGRDELLEVKKTGPSEDHWES